MAMTDEEKQLKKQRRAENKLFKTELLRKMDECNTAEAMYKDVIEPFIQVVDNTLEALNNSSRWNHPIRASIYFDKTNFVRNLTGDTKFVHQFVSDYLTECRYSTCYSFRTSNTKKSGTKHGKPADSFRTEIIRKTDKLIGDELIKDDPDWWDVFDLLKTAVIEPFVKALEGVCEARGYQYNIYSGKSNFIVNGREEDVIVIHKMIEEYHLYAGTYSDEFTFKDDSVSPQKDEIEIYTDGTVRFIEPKFTNMMIIWLVMYEPEENAANPVDRATAFDRKYKEDSYVYQHRDSYVNGKWPRSDAIDFYVLPLNHK